MTADQARRALQKTLESRSNNSDNSVAIFDAVLKATTEAKFYVEVDEDVMTARTRMRLEAFGYHIDEVAYGFIVTW